MEVNYWMEVNHWLSFCAVALVATATPGPAALLVAITSLSVGFKKSLATVLGNVTGLMIMSSLSVLGLSAIIVQSAIAFTLIKTVGALYLIYTGIKLFRSGVTPPPNTKKKPSKGLTPSYLINESPVLNASSAINTSKSSGVSSRGSILFGQGIMVALTNPKAIVFTMALFPQFISLSSPLAPQFLVLVISFMGLSFTCLSTYAYLAQKVKPKVGNSVVGRLAKKCCGSLFIGFGGYLALANRPL